MKSLTKGRIKQLTVKWGIMLGPVFLAGLVMLIVQHPRKAQAYQSPPSFRILFYPNCSPAWAGGTIWQQGIDIPDPSHGIPTGPYCGAPAYLPGYLPQFIGFNDQAVLVIDTTTNYCGQGDITLGYAWTQISRIPTVWNDVAGSTNIVAMPNGYTEAKWQVENVTTFNYGTVPMLGNASGTVWCPGGTGTGGQ